MIAMSRSSARYSNAWRSSGLGMPATWFCTRHGCRGFSAPLRAWRDGATRIGCHGLAMAAWED